MMKQPFAPEPAPQVSLSVNVAKLAADMGALGLVAVRGQHGPAMCRAHDKDLVCVSCERELERK